MDKDNDKLADYFNQAMNEEETPSFIWDNIAHDIDSADMSVIKNGFQDFYGHKEPNGQIWDNIQKSLDEAPADMLEDVFNEFYATEEPNSQIWTNIQDEIDITNTWDQIQQKLDSQENWKQRFQRLGAVAMLLLLLQTCVNQGYVPQSISSLFDTNPVEVVAVSNQQLSSNSNLNDSNKKKKSTLDKQKSNSSLVTDRVQNKAKQNSLNLEKKTIANSTVTNNTSSHQGQNSADKNTKRAVTTLALVNKNNYINSKESYDNEIANKTQQSSPATKIITTLTNPILEPNTESKEKDKTPNSSKNNTLIVGVATSTPTKNITSEQKNYSASSNKKNTSNNLAKSYDLGLLPAITVDNIEESPSQLPLAKTYSFALENFSTKKNKRFPKFELGLIGKIGTSFLLNEMTTEGLRYSSLQDTRLQLTGNISLIAGVKITDKDAITLQVTPYSPTNQTFSSFSKDGIFSQHEIKLSYLDFAIGYERDWLIFEMSNQNQARVFTRLDIGLSHLVQEKVLLNTEEIQQQTFKKWNISIGLALGSKYQFKRFVLDYGIYGSIGLNNINNNTHLGSQPTNLANLGGFIGLRYKL